MRTDAVTPLRHRMIEDMNARKLSAGTQKGHIHSCKRFAAFLTRAPDTATTEDIRRFETLSEPSIDWRQQAVCPIVLSPIAPELSEAHGAAQLERFRLLPLRDADRTPEAGLAFGKAPPGHHERPSQPVNFGLPPALAAFFAYRQCIRQRRERTLIWIQIRRGIATVTLRRLSRRGSVWSPAQRYRSRTSGPRSRPRSCV